ncbi:MAG: family 43 glycosylhydrolase, partial [Mycobacterium sp.]
GYPANPILTARSTAEPVQNVGHADLVDTPDGLTFAVALGVRPVGFTRSFSPLGRETFLTPVDWVDGWPHPRPILNESLAPRDTASLELDLAAPGTLDHPAWIGLRRQPREVASVTDSGLTITSRGSGLSDLDVAFVGRRQHHHTATFRTTIAPSSGVGGLAARQSDELWFAVEAEASDGAVRVRAVAALAGISQSWEHEFPGAEVTLTMEFSVAAPYRPGDGLPPTGGDRIRLTASDGGDSVTLAELDGRYWSFETSESFTGRVIGLYATRGAVTFRSLTITE